MSTRIVVITNPYDPDIQTELHFETGEAWHVERDGQRTLSQYRVPHWEQRCRRLGITILELDDDLRMDEGL